MSKGPSPERGLAPAPPLTRIPRSRILDPRFERYRIFSAAVERLPHRLPLVGRAGVVRRRALSPVERHSERSHPEVGGGDRRSQRVTGGLPTLPMGNTRDRQGRLVTCEHGGRRVTRTGYDGRITVLVDRIGGRRLNSPNDVVVKSERVRFWFTDSALRHPRRLRGPPGGAGAAGGGVPHRRCERRGHAPGRRRVGSERPVLLARRAAALRGRVARRAASQDPGLRRHQRRPRDCQQARADRRRAERYAGTGCVATWTGICGAAGAWGSEALDGVLVFAPDGTAIGRIALTGAPARTSASVWGKRNRLFMAASQSLYALYVNTQGAPGG